MHKFSNWTAIGWQDPRFPSRTLPKASGKQACLLPIVHPGAMCCSGKQRTRTWPCRWCKRKCDLSDRPPSFIAPWSSSDAHLLIVGTFGSGQGSAWTPWLVCGFAAPYTTNCNAHCVFWHLCIRTSINFFSKVSNSSLSVGSDHTGQPMLPTGISEPWLPMTLSAVPNCSFLHALQGRAEVLSLLLKTQSDSAVLTLVGSLFHHWGSRTEKSCDFAAQPLFALSQRSGYAATVKLQKLGVQ